MAYRYLSDQKFYPSTNGLYLRSKAKKQLSLQCFYSLLSEGIRKREEDHAFLKAGLAS